MSRNAVFLAQLPRKGGCLPEAYAAVVRKAPPAAGSSEYLLGRGTHTGLRFSAHRTTPFFSPVGLKSPLLWDFPYRWIFPPRGPLYLLIVVVERVHPVFHLVSVFKQSHLLPPPS